MKHMIPEHLAVKSAGTLNGSSHLKVMFPNEYGASVISDGYGHEDSPYEVAVLGADGRLTFDTPITDGVLGYLTEAEVSAVLCDIAGLPITDYTDSHPAPGVTLRRWSGSARIDLYEGGWRAGTYKTEQGASHAVERIKARREAEGS